MSNRAWIVSMGLALVAVGSTGGMVAFAARGESAEADVVAPSTTVTAVATPSVEPGALVQGAVDVTRLTADGSLSDFQRSIFADGVVTFDEYRGAVEREITCATSEGAVLIDPREPIADGHLKAIDSPVLRSRGYYDYTYGGTRNAQSSYTAAVASCKAEFSEWVVAYWMAHLRPSDSELDAGRASLGACLQDAGVAVPQPPTADDLAALFHRATSDQTGATGGVLAAYGRCVESIRLDLDDPQFMGF